MNMSTRTLPSSEIHLFLSTFEGTTPGRSSGAGVDEAEPGPAPLPRPLVVPPAPVRLEWNTAGEPRLAPGDPGAGSADQAAGPWLEALIGSGMPPRLLLLAPAGRRPRVNGGPGSRITLLRGADEFYFDGSCTFRVAIFDRPQLGLAPAALAGQPCAVCTTPVQAEDRCLICACGAALHAAEEETAEGALACVHLTRECPRCQRPLLLVPGYEDAAGGDTDPRSEPGVHGAPGGAGSEPQGGTDA